MKKEMAEIDITVSENLKKYYLIPNKIKDAELAALLDLSISGARKVKNGESGLNMKKLDIIYKESGITPNQLYFGDNDPDMEKRKIVSIGELVVSMEKFPPAERKNKLVQYAELFLNLANNINV